MRFQIKTLYSSFHTCFYLVPILFNALSKKVELLFFQYVTVGNLEAISLIARCLKFIRSKKFNLESFLDMSLIAFLALIGKRFFNQ